MIASLPVERSECTEESVAELAGCSAKVRLAYHQQRTPAMQEEAAIDIGALNRRVADLEIESASRKGAAFVFIKPHAVTEQVKDLVSKRFGAGDISVISEIDTHCGTIAAKAMKQKPGDLTVQQKSQDEFQKAFGRGRTRWSRDWSTTSSTARPSWASPCPSWEPSTTS